jgi:hypothetical protein
MRRPERVAVAELNRFGKGAMHITSIVPLSLPTFTDPYAYPPPQSNTEDLPRAPARSQPHEGPPDSYVMQYEFPALASRDPRRERPRRVLEPTTVTYPDKRLPSRRQMRKIFHRQLNSIESKKVPEPTGDFDIVPLSRF